MTPLPATSTSRRQTSRRQQLQPASAAAGVDTPQSPLAPQSPSAPSVSAMTTPLPAGKVFTTSKRKSPGYGSSRPNPNLGKVCSRGFGDCGATPGEYDPVTRRMLGRKHHSVACNYVWKASGAVSLVGSDAHRRKRGRNYDGRARGDKAVSAAVRAAVVSAQRPAGQGSSLKQVTEAVGLAPATTSAMAGR
jgi:hypothetical protein